MVRKDKDGDRRKRERERKKEREERDSPMLATCVDCVLDYVID